METTSLAKEEEEGIIRCCASVVRARATRDTPAGEKASVDEDARKAAATRLGMKRTIDVDISIDELVEVGVVLDTTSEGPHSLFVQIVTRFVQIVTKYT